MEDEYLVGFFSYNSKEASDKALAEQKRITKLESQMDYSKPKLVYSLYCKIIDRNLFETLEGINYLVHIQNYLYENENVLENPIPAIPARLLVNAGILDVASNNQQSDAIELLQNESVEENADDNTSDISSENVVNTATDKSEEKKDVKKAKESNDLTYKIIIAFLIFIIVAMMFIAMRSDSPNIINYRNEIQNEYSEWEHQLKEKEKELNAKEKELNNY